MASEFAYVRQELAVDQPAPTSTVGGVAWARAKLFSNWWHTLLTLAGALVGLWIAWAMIDFLLIRAVWTGENREACISPRVGACWPFIWAKMNQFIYGFYPASQRWRANVVFFLGAVLLATLLTPRVPYKLLNAILFFGVYPVVAYFLLVGGSFGIPQVQTRQWGGLLVTLVVAVTGIVASLPLGIVLALGRRSKMPIVRMFCVVFIEFWRGVPLITVLFFATYMLPFFLPRGVEFDGLLRALVGVALFSAAYMAEVVRGGLQAIPRGQYEGAMALGLSYWKMTGLVVLPQALKMVIPGIVNTFIGLFKDTTLVLIVAILDLLGQIRNALADPNWITPVSVYTAFAFAGIVYFAFCFGMSRYSIFMEQRLQTGHKR